MLQLRGYHFPIRAAETHPHPPEPSPACSRGLGPQGPREPTLYLHGGARGWAAQVLALDDTGPARGRSGSRAALPQDSSAPASRGALLGRGAPACLRCPHPTSALGHGPHVMTWLQVPKGWAAVTPVLAPPHPLEQVQGSRKRPRSQPLPVQQVPILHGQGTVSPPQPNLGPCGAWWDGGWEGCRGLESQVGGPRSATPRGRALSRRAHN